MKTSIIGGIHKQGPWQNPGFRLALLGLGLLLILALLADLRNAMKRRQAELSQLKALERPEALLLGIADRRYESPGGRFAITLPEPWIRWDGKRADPYTAVFRGPQNIEISVVVSELPHDRFDLLLAQIRGREQQLEVQMNIRTIEFQGRPAIERRSRLPRNSVYALDFMVGNIAHHIIVSIPREDFDRFLSPVLDILQTYEAPAGRRWTRAPEVGAPAMNEAQKPENSESVHF